jgi:hypothetical protein
MHRTLNEQHRRVARPSRQAAGSRSDKKPRHANTKMLNAVIH